jgi:uncharacterized phage protein gp47/JayE
MPWTTPSLKEVRSLVRDQIRGSLPGADASIPNSVLRVLSDCQGALCHLTLQYIDWLALQLLPDTAETEWLDRHGDIWLTNADGTTGRKLATLSEGTVAFTGDEGGLIIPIHTQLEHSQISYETTMAAVTSANGNPVEVPVRALDAGSIGNLPDGETLTVTSNIPGGVSTLVTVIHLDGGTDTESDDDLRIRVLERIRQPPMGGAAHDYVRWAKAVPGVTRAWCSPNEMGIGTVTVRILCDDLRAEDDGWPTSDDLDRTKAYIDTVRPVAVKDFWVLAPIKQFVDIHISNLVPDTAENRAAIEESLLEMLYNNAAPGQTIFAVWKAQAIMNTANVTSFELTNWVDDIMESVGHMAVLGDIVYDE